jgi:integrase
MTARKARRAKRGSGSVYYARSARRWEAVITVTDPDTGQRRRVKQTARTREDAEALLAAMAAERRGTGTVAAKDYTVAHAVADMLRYQPATWKSPTTVEVNTRHAARLTAALGTVTLARLTPGQVERHLLAEVTRPRRPLSASTVRDELFFLRRAIERAERDGLVTRNAAALARMPAGAARRESESMTVEQVSQLLASDLSPLWRAWVTTAVMLGLRPGEVAGLAWEDVGDDGVLRVRHSLHDVPGGGLARGGLKTERSKRSLVMPAAVIGALTAWRAEQLTQQLAAGPLWQGTGLVFTTGWGRPYSRQRANYEWKKACRAAGLGDRWQIRELRHTFVSVLNHSGVDIEQIADLAGHANSHVTKVVYRHLLADKLGTAATVMDQVFSREAGTP